MPHRKVDADDPAASRRIGVNALNSADPVVPQSAEYGLSVGIRSLMDFSEADATGILASEGG